MPDGTNIVPDDLAGLKKDLASVSEQVKEFATSINAKMQAGAEVSAELKEKADKALTEQGALRAQVDQVLADQAAFRARQDEVEQKMARRGSEQQQQAQGQRSPGEMFVADERVKKFMEERAHRGRVRVDMAAITTVTGGATRDVLVAADRVAGLVAPPDRRMTVRDLLTPGRTGSNSIQYVREVGFSNAAASVSEGALKPESDIDFELITQAVITIAHIVKASKQILDDAPMLQSHIDGRLRYGLAYVEEVQLLNGAGGSDLDGLIPNATAFSRTFTPEGPTRIDDIRLAMLQAELALFPASGTVLHPTDWARIELTKDLENRYIFAQPQTLAGPTLWSRPVVATPAMTVTKFLTGAFKLGAQIFDREDAAVDLSTEDSDNFSRNLCTLRAEERLALAIYRPESIIYGTFMTGT